MKRAVFAGMFPSIMLMPLVQKRYFPRFCFICAAVAGRPMYSMTHEPLGMRSSVKRPLPLCERRTVRRKGPGVKRRFIGERNSRDHVEAMAGKAASPHAGRYGHVSADNAEAVGIINSVSCYPLLKQT